MNPRISPSHSSTSLGVLLAVTFSCLGSTAHAAVVIDPLSWGLTEGQTFRLVVVTTGTTTATSTSISSYDTFVNSQGLSGITYNGSSVAWQAIGLTEGSNPVSDVTRFSSLANASIVYNLAGQLVANTTAGTRFWQTSGFNQHLAGIDRTINGSGNLEQLPFSTRVWTGFDTDGQPSTAQDYDNGGNSVGTVTSALGSAPTYQGYDFDSNTPLPGQTLFPSFGSAGALFNGWSSAGNDAALGTSHRMYAMSGPITVTAAGVPEAGTWGAGGALLGAGWLGWRRCQRR